ncbi:MAG: peptide-methionine (R)-S-oxide reductase MsrB [Patescibacteria group bacterium]
MEKINKPNEDWERELTAEQYEVMRRKGTEAPFTGEYVSEKRSGMYKCAACGAELFASTTKFDSGTGWPSFTDPVNREHVVLTEDVSHGMHRTEVSCAACGSHLGHVFNDGPKVMPDGRPASGARYCINSVCLKLEPESES